ncbi:hypothetical protein CQA47_08990 [Enterobacter hormaechei]|nr:hypothetical protein CQA47_08990 [Enterobacter hormaechei]
MPFNTTKITLAIIINFIYYRHSVLNVCLSLIEPDASHSVFFTFLYVSLHFMCYPSEMITTIN